MPVIDGVWAAQRKNLPRNMLLLKSLDRGCNFLLSTEWGRGEKLQILNSIRATDIDLEYG